MAILTMVIKKVENLGKGIAFNIEYRGDQYLLLINESGKNWSRLIEQFSYSSTYESVDDKEAQTLNRAWSKVKFLP